jgi:hypothetical protein
MGHAEIKAILNGAKTQINSQSAAKSLILRKRSTTIPVVGSRLPKQ